MTLKPFSLVAILILAGATSQAGVINFNALSGSFATYTDQGVTFSPIGTGSLLAAGDPNGTIGFLAPDLVGGYLEIRADIGGGASSVSVDLGDFDSDPDGLYLQIFNSSNVSLGFATLTTTADDSNMHTLTLASAGIAYATFGSRAPSLAGSSVYSDNFTWNSVTTTPEPGAIFLTAGGLFALLLRRRLQKS